MSEKPVDNPVDNFGGSSTRGGEREMLTLEEMANVLKVKTSWMYHQTFKGTIPYFKVGRHLRFDRSEVLNSIKKVPIRAN